MENENIPYAIPNGEINNEMFKIIHQLAAVRTYNAAGIFKGVMVKDKEKAHELIHRARGFIERVEMGHYDTKTQ